MQKSEYQDSPSSGWNKTLITCGTGKGEQAVQQENAFRVVDRKQEIVIICLSFVLSFMDAGHWENIY